MGLYLRKRFRSGPVRLNLSSRGVGFSFGVKGARVSVGPRGPHVHLGRGGLYYRKKLGALGLDSDLKDAAPGCYYLFAGAWVVLGVVFALIFAAVAIHWLYNHAFVTVLAVTLTALITMWPIFRRKRDDRAINAYKAILDTAFVIAPVPPSPPEAAEIRNIQSQLPRDHSSSRKVELMEATIYQAVLDRVLDDGVITPAEAAMIVSAESLLRLNSDAKLAVKKEIFASAFVEVVADEQVTKTELGRLKNLVSGLGIPAIEIAREQAILEDVVGAQSLRHPLAPLPDNVLLAPVQKSERVYWQCSARVMSARKSRLAPSGFEYTVRREGTLVVTNKRAFVIGAGVTNVRFDEVSDVDVDVDDGVIELHKITSGKPTIIAVDRPFMTGRIVDMALEEWSNGESK